MVVEVISKSFARLPDTVLLPWLPTLITTLRDNARELVPVLVREAGRTFPGSLAAVDTWVPPWSRRPAEAPVAPTPSGPVADLLTAHPAAYEAVVDLLGYDRTAGAAPRPSAAAALLARHPETADAVATLLGPAPDPVRAGDPPRGGS